MELHSVPEAKPELIPAQALRASNCFKPEDSVSTVLKDSKELPILVTDTGKASGRLLGIVTTFDLL
jgi:hypothetical protein